MLTRREKKEGKEPLASSDSFCWNRECADYGRVDAGNLRKFGFTRKGRQRWQCTTCQKVVAETRGTLFHGKRYDEQTILECLAMLAERNSLASIRRVKGIKEDTINSWLAEIAPQMEQIEEVLLRHHRLSPAQLDALWTFVGHKGAKGGARRNPTAALSGAGRPWRLTPGSESGAPSRRRKKKSRSN
jgi:transposase-like protein